MRFSELRRVTDPQRYDEIGLLEFSEQADLSRPQYDSRKVGDGDTFFAVRGLQTNGHNYIRAAIERGATTIVFDDVEKVSDGTAYDPSVAFVRVRDSRKALALLSEAYFDFPSAKLRMIGVTGTNGKTTVTNVIKQLLELRDERVGLIGTLGILIADESLEATHTTPESRDLSDLLARMVAAGVTTCVMEVSSHSLALDRVLAIDFDIAVFTNLTQDHLDFHKTMEDYFKAKQLLFNRLKDTAVAITNADDASGDRMVEETVANAHRYGVVKAGALPAEQHADLYATNVSLELAGTSFTVRKRYSEEAAEFRTHLVGEFNVENLLAAVSALYFGIEGCSLESLAKAAPHVSPISGRFEALALPNSASAIIDYAHTPDALEKVLKTARTLTKGSVFVVFGCGGDRDRSKRPQMGRIAAQLADRAYITTDNPRTEDPASILGEIVAGVPEEYVRKLTVIADRAEAIRAALDASTAETAVVIAGKGHETYQIIGKEKHHFDDREQVEAWMKSHFG